MVRTFVRSGRGVPLALRLGGRFADLIADPTAPISPAPRAARTIGRRLGADAFLHLAAPSWHDRIDGDHH